MVFRSLKHVICGTLRPTVSGKLEQSYTLYILSKHDSYPRLVYYGVLNRLGSLRFIADKVETDDASKVSIRPDVDKQTSHGSGISKHSSDDDDDENDSKWKLEPAWLLKALEPALQMCRWALPTGNGNEAKSPSTTKSLAEIIAGIQRSKVGIQDWSLSDFTIGLYLIYLRQASANPFDDVKGDQIATEPIVQELIYYTELAKGCYKDSAKSLARHSMLRESNVLKFIRDSSVMRPGYYIGVDHRKKHVIFGIRGTHNVYDLITDIVSAGDEEVTYEGYSTHFGTAEAARWLLTQEMGTIRRCLEKHEGYRLRLVGHSLGGATASLLAIMIRRKSFKELGFSPDIVSAVGYATPPCVSKELAESCSEYVTTVVMQDDIIPKLSVASITRLRNEILQTDWMSVLEKEDWKSVVDLVTNAKQVVSTVQDVARKVSHYAQFKSNVANSDVPVRNESDGTSNSSLTSKAQAESALAIKQKVSDLKTPEELFIPGTVYCLRRNTDPHGGSKEFFTLWKRHPGEHFQRIVLSSNIVSDHKCDSHYYALRDVLKGMPGE